jgi:hypothetical protein
MINKKENQLLKAALAYARRGWPVFPLHTPIRGLCSCGKDCSSPGKHPRTPHGLKDASVDPRIIREWWRKWPLANIGIVAGARSGLLVLDIDGPAGERFVSKKGVPITVSSRTKKGKHLFFAYPGKPIKNRVRCGPELDVRGEEGYVVGPPSLHASGFRYAWIPGCGPDDLAVAAAPEWLLELLQDSPENETEASAGQDVVEQGQRNNYLIRQAGGMRRKGMGKKAILAALLAENDERCKPPLDEEEVGRIAESAAHYKPQPDAKRGPKDSTKLLNLAAEAELFHYGDQGYATIAVNDHKENWFIRGSMFRRWLQKQFYQAEGRAVNATTLQEALETLEAKALFEGTEQKVYTRLAGHDDKIYLDLANADWEAIEITKDGWDVIANPPVKFRRPRGMLPLPTPVSGGSMDELRKLVNLSQDGEVLLWAWLVASLYPRGPYPILILRGEQGSSKSTLARVVRALIDPNACPLRAGPREERDLMVAAANGWIIALDNMSSLSGWLSDALCRVSTGGGFSTRQLFTDDEEKLFDVQRPISLNGIEEFATRGDILDRAIILHLPSIPGDKRKAESSFWKEFENSHQRILGALLDALSTALRNLPNVNLPRLPRMADFARLATATEAAFKWEPGRFMRTYSAYIEDVHNVVLEDSPIVAPLMRLMGREILWRGTVTDLLALLLKEVGQRGTTVPTQRMAGHWAETF